MPEIRYARSGDVHIAYEVHDGGVEPGLDVVMVNGGLYPMASLGADPMARRLLEGLAALGRLVVFDRRGVGLSDAIDDWRRPLFEQWAEDLWAVVEDAGLARPVVFSWHTTPVARAFAAHHPDRLDRLVLLNPGAGNRPEDRSWQRDVVGAMLTGVEGESDWMARILPSRWADSGFRAWSDEAGRVGASPAAASRILRVDFDPATFARAEALAARITVPTLVLVRTPGFIPAGYFARAAEAIPGATVVDLSPGDVFPLSAVDDLLFEVTSFVGGAPRVPPAERLLAAVLFSDVVGSTEQAARLGDERWKASLDRHDAIVASCVGRGGGTVVKSTGDGALATLPSVTAALRAAREIRDRVGAEGLQVRVGIHVGEIDRRGDDVSGLEVHVAARVMAAATPGQILVSRRAAEVAGEPARFTSVGRRSLKGLDGEWELFALAAS